jgi:hypothetical protein
MTTPHQEPQPGTWEHFLQVTTWQRWGTIQTPPRPPLHPCALKLTLSRESLFGRRLVNPEDRMNLQRG